MNEEDNLTIFIYTTMRAKETTYMHANSVDVVMRILVRTIRIKGAPVNNTNGLTTMNVK